MGEKLSKQEFRKLLHYPEDETLFNMQSQLGILAGMWRGEKRRNGKRSRQLVADYHATMREMLERGWDGDLDVDAELPLKLMPREYFELRPDVLEGTGYGLSDFESLKRTE